MWNQFLHLNLALLQEAQEPSGFGGTAGPDLSRYFMVCAILIVVTAGLAWGLKKVIAGNLQQRGTQRSLQVVDVLGLGGKRKLAVVRCYDRTFVVGLGEREITPIAELDGAIGEDLPQPLPPKSHSQAFAQALEQVRQAMPSKSVSRSRQAVDQPPPALKTKTVNPAPRADAQSTQPTQAEARKVIRKRRKVKSKRPKVATPEAQTSRLDPREVASAALRIAEDKLRLRQAQAAGQAAAPTRPAREVTIQPTAAKSAPETLRLEGIIG